MRRLARFMTAAAVSLSLLQTFVPQAVRDTAEAATDYYPMGCSAYEVDTIDNSSAFVKSGCYSTFAEAKVKMAEAGNDAVVRHPAGKSPSKIIAMTRGIAYSYPMRSGSTTLNINQINGTKSTYMIKHRELAYFDTLSYDGSGNGNIRVNVSGFEGAAELKNIDLVPYKFIENGRGIWLGGNDATAQNEQPFKVNVIQDYYTAEVHGSYTDLVMYCFSGWQSTTSDKPAIKLQVSVGPAPEWMEPGRKYYSYNDYEFFTDRYFTKKAGTYFNYYTYLPLRTKSVVKASQYDAYLKSRLGSSASGSVMLGEGQAFINAGENYGMNALLIYAQACIESGYGKSNYAVNRKNLFGWGAVDSNPNQAAYYSSIEKGISDHIGIQMRSYLYTPDFRFFGSHFGSKGSGITVKYASGPYYGALIASIAYAIDKSISGKGLLTEYNRYTLGIVTEFDTYFYDRINGQELFSSRYGPTYQLNHTVVVLGEKNGWDKIQSTNYLDEGAIRQFSTKDPAVKYDWEKNTVWIKKDKVKLINDTPVKNLGGDSTPAPTPTPTPKPTPTPTSTPKPTPAPSSETSMEMHRLYNPNSGEHFYTGDAVEKNALVKLGWKYEGVGWNAPLKSSIPVYRLYNREGGEHHYTTDTAERDALISRGWKDEGTGWYSDEGKGKPVYREYNPNAYSCNHNYTAEKKEHDALVSYGWKDEGIAWYGLK